MNMIASSGLNGRSRKPPVKSACLACRSTKTRCDGLNPCQVCSIKGRECLYRPSRRGGSKKSFKRAITEAQKVNASEVLTANITTEDQLLEQIYNLEDPWNNLQNLDLLSESFFQNGDTQFRHQQSTVNALDVAGSDPGEGVSMIRTYNNESDILNAYYIFIHPYFPILPPPVHDLYDDRPLTFSLGESELSDTSALDLPLSSTSPLTQALLAMLTLIPHHSDKGAKLKNSVQVRRLLAQRYSSSALYKIENDLGSITPPSFRLKDLQTNDSTPPFRCLHPETPFVLESVLALLVLSMYEFCERGNLPKMRIRANHAMMTAMDLGLYDINKTEPSFGEAYRRAWWMTVFMNYQSSTVNFIPPIISIDDHRIKTLFPSFNVSPEPWPLLARALHVLYTSSIMLRDISRTLSRSTSLPSSMKNELRNMDHTIRRCIVDSDSEIRQAGQGVSELKVAGVLWGVARFSLHSALIKLHRVRAFADMPLFFEEYCDLTAMNPIPLGIHLNNGEDSDSGTPTNSQSSINKNSLQYAESIDANFPFSLHDSTVICLKSALVTVRVCRQLPKPEAYPRVETNNGSDLLSKPYVSEFRGAVPYFACCAIQSCYVMLMIIYKVKTAILAGELQQFSYLFSHPESGTQIQDAERLIEELRNGLEVMIGVFKACHVAFEAITGLADEVQGAFEIAFSNSN